MVAMNMPTISPADARALMATGATLIDIREPDEHRRLRIPGARNVPVAKLAPVSGKQAVIYHCKSGMRTAGNAARLSAMSDCPAYLLEGGLDAWAAAGLPVEQDRRAPLEIMRQVQITAGALILAGVLLSLTVSTAFVALSAFVGAGLVMAGTTGWCGMARLLAKMPWNRRPAA